jgi:hypothetical protein
MERTHVRHLERETVSVERREGEPLDALRQQSEAASQLRIRQEAIEKGQTRIQAAEQFSRQSTREIEMYNQTSVSNYEKRYRHAIWLRRDDTIDLLVIDTYIKGLSGASIVPCYRNGISFRKDAGTGDISHIFYGVQNFKRRLPENSPAYRLDNDVKYKGTKPLPHADILFNQIRAANEYLAQQRESVWPTQFDLAIYQGRDIVNRSDQKIFDTLLPQETGEVLFSKGTDGYKAMAGCETGKAKWMLAAQLGKEVFGVKLVKKEEMKEEGEKEIKYHTKYYFGVATQEVGPH